MKSQNIKSPELQKSKKKKYSILMLHIFILIVVICSVMMKTTFWGIHFWNYISPVFLIAYIVTYISLSIFIKAGSNLQHDAIRASDIIVAGLVTLGISIFYYYFIIKTDIYGDHRTILNRQLSNPKNTDPYIELKKLFSPQIFTSHNGEAFIFSLARIINYYTGSSIPHSFRIINFIASIIFNISLIKILQKAFKESRAMFYMFLCIALAGGYTLFFHGYIEVYPMAIGVFMCYLYFFYRAYKQNTNRSLIICLLALFFSIKLNSAGFLLAPSFVMLIIHQKKKITFNLKKGLLYIYIPICIIGALAYVFVFSNIKGTQIVKIGSNPILNMFLPLISDETPHSSYTLLSGSHIIDFLNIIMFCTLGGCAVILHNMISKRKKNKSTVYYISLVQFLVFLTFYFMINPILSIVRDFDLYMLIAPSFLFFIIISSKEIMDTFTLKKIVLIILISLFQIPVHIVNLEKNLIKYRIEDIGYHSYKTYWVGSSYILNVAANYDSTNTSKHIERRHKIVKTIKSLVTKKNDQEYALLLNNLAIVYFQTKDYENSFIYFNMAAIQLPIERYYEYAAYSLYNANKKMEAYKYIYPIIPGSQNPDLIKFYIQLTIELKNYRETLNACIQYNSKFPDDKSLVSLTTNLQRMLE